MHKDSDTIKSIKRAHSEATSDLHITLIIIITVIQLYNKYGIKNRNLIRIPSFKIYILDTSLTTLDNRE